MKRRAFIKNTGVAGMLTLITPYSIAGTLNPAKGKIKIFDLQCEYLTDPLGIDVETPRFSWKLSDDLRGQKQTGYQILVASSKSLLNREKADVWDSGSVLSSQSTLVPFAGKKLTSGQDCYWKVRVLDKNKKLSSWSSAARFSVGLLNQHDWMGTWIKHPTAPVEKHIWFRKNVSLKKSPVSAFIYISSIGYHELYVNGKKVDSSVLAPSLTRIDKRATYVTHDITTALHIGINTIAVWYGPGWSRYGGFKAHPALMVQLNAKMTDGETTIISSDQTWRCKVSSSENFGGGHGGEKVIVQNYLPNWNKADLDDSQWEFAAATPVEAVLSSQMIEPSRIIEIIDARNIFGTGPYKIDMGKNFTGWIRVRMRNLSAGDKVIIKIADDPVSIQDFGQQSQYVSNGNPLDTFQNRFNYSGGRYITIEGLKEKPELSDITGYAVGTDLKRVGQFSSSSDLFNKIYEMDLWTFRANTIEGFTDDCPHRERLGYGEVAFATSWGCGLPNYQAGAFYTKVVRDWCDVQDEKGWINHVAPQIIKAGGGPMWSSAPLNISWEFYKTYGDKQILFNAYPAIKSWLEFLKSNVNEGLLSAYNAGSGLQWWLGDWAAPNHRSERGDTPEAVFFNNCVYAMDLQTFVQIARILGKTEDVDLYSKRLEELRKNVQSKFFNPDTNTYLSGQQIQLAFPMLTNITPESLKPAVYANFENEIMQKRPYLDMGSSGLPVLLKYLIENVERNDILFEHLSKTTEPSYGYFISRGETTWPEYWNVDVASKIHTCYTGIASWFIKGLGGIHSDPAQPGYQSFIIKPALAGDLTFANVTTESLYGTIVSHWEKKGDTIEMNVSIPVNSLATVYVPANDVKNVTESGSEVQTTEGVTFLKMEGKYAVFQVQSGNYRFLSKGNLR
jgi:alpha-L-rhamnosidase